MGEAEERGVRFASFLLSSRIMRIVLVACAVVAQLKLCTASTVQMQRDLNHYTYNSSARAFAGVMANAIAQLDEYGCWCYFNNNHGRGKSQPVDEADAYCKILHDGYECAIRDSLDEGIDCVPWEIPYTSGTNEQNINAGCVQANPDNFCAQRACAVEGQFVQNMFMV